MLHEMIMYLGLGEPDPGVAALVIATSFRDDLPWFYEMGVEVYRQSLSAKPTALARAYRKFMEAAEFAARGPFSGELSSERMRLLLQDVPMLLRDFDRPAGRAPKAS
jgi:hypothetical protein